MDEFAQSREDDDLFADDFEPVSTPIAEIEPSPIPTQPRAAVGKPATTGGGNQQQQQQQRNGNGRQGGRERRGRGGGRGGGNNGLGGSRYASQTQADSSTTISKVENPPTAPNTIKFTPQNTTVPQSTDLRNESTPPAPNTTMNTNTNVPAITEPRIHAVRGDRSATGGPPKKGKLTEEELSQKMAQMAILNAQKAEKHRLTEADQAAFQHREKELAKERREKAAAEKKNERVMEMERAKNRERKMKAQGVREWDSEKVEDDIVDRTKGRSGEYVRGGHGGTISRGLAGSKYSVAEYDADDGQEYQNSRGRGEFEIRGRGGRGGRGGKGGKAGNSNVIPTAEDFPSLPTSAKPSATPSSGATKKELFPEKMKSPTIEKPAGNWAEEMATPIEEKKMVI
ncbi:uncharacterized protein RSE6_03410 [Rhynchosporium secalis]|uniref:Uncharacterized protein n=1 Tax=Rhynchosporium secalis TaxID=38038 RepID=A0A1E1M2P5_RHYSE|nr:uncharacterized protein RSE6_03410 [Rhynchosporium secalis]